MTKRNRIIRKLGNAYRAATVGNIAWRQSRLPPDPKAPARVRRWVFRAEHAGIVLSPDVKAVASSAVLI